MAAKEGDGPPNPIEKQNPTSTVKPDQKTLTFAEALGGASGGSQSLRKYAEIIALQKKERNVLELKLRKIKPINKHSRGGKCPQPDIQPGTAQPPVAF